jgi:hypothetical protein
MHQKRFPEQNINSFKDYNILDETQGRLSIFDIIKFCNTKFNYEYTERREFNYNWTH